MNRVGLAAGQARLQTVPVSQERPSLGQYFWGVAVTTACTRMGSAVTQEFLVELGRKVLESAGSGWQLDSSLGLNLQEALVDSLTALGESCPESEEVLGLQI